MGAVAFQAIERGATPEVAFRIAVDSAQGYYGSGGYTGTIAEKSTFVMVTPPEGFTPVQYADQMIELDDERINDKWGPAGCIEIGYQTYLFFGWASS